VPGFPIRKSSDHSPVAGSSRLIAGSNVLHRLLVPRHPPYALRNLATLACARTLKGFARRLDARVHYAVLKLRTENPAPSAYPRRASRARDEYSYFALPGRNCLTRSGKIRVLGESAPYGCFLRTQQRAHSALRSVRSFREPAEARSVLTAPSRAGSVNNQCSTRKHGRPRRHSLRKDAGAP
jgi:hypothetical protein